MDWGPVLDTGDWIRNVAKGDDSDDVIGDVKRLSFKSDLWLGTWAEYSAMEASCRVVLFSSVFREGVEHASVDTFKSSSSDSLAEPNSSITIRLRAF